MNKLNKIKKIRNQLKQGKATIGSWIQIPNNSIAEILGQSGYDWVAVDMEHGAISPHQLPDLFRALELGDTLPLVRLARGHSKDVKQALDSGAGGVIIPMIESAAQLENVIKHSCWPPAGIRGVGFSRANLFGKYFNDYLKQAQSPFIIAQIEHINAVNDIVSIVNVQGLDGIIIGPYDLSASMGLTGQFDHPDFRQALNKIKKACKENHIPSGLHIVQPDPADLLQKIKDGYLFIAYSMDSVFLTNSALNPVKK